MCKIQVDDFDDWYITAYLMVINVILIDGYIEPLHVVNVSLNLSFNDYHEILKYQSFMSFITMGIWGLEIAEKVWRGFKYLFHIYLMRGSQQYQENWNRTVAFWATT